MVFGLRSLVLLSAILPLAGLPTDFPRDVPLYPGATVRSAGASAMELVVLETPDPRGKLLTFYTAALPQNGWKLENSYGVSPEDVQGSKGRRLIGITLVEQHAGTKSTTLIQIRLTGEM